MRLVATGLPGPSTDTTTSGDQPTTAEADPTSVPAATGDHDQLAPCWTTLPTYPIIPLIGRSTGLVRAVAVAVAVVPMPDGRALLAVADNHEVRLWDPMSGQQVGKPLTGHTDRVTALAVVPMLDGRVLLASASEDGTVRLWDPVTRQLVGEPFAGHTGQVSALAVVPVPDGRVLIASASEDGTVRLWDPVTGQQVGAQPRHPVGRGGATP